MAAVVTNRRKYDKDEGFSNFDLGTDGSDGTVPPKSLFVAGHTAAVRYATPRTMFALLGPCPCAPWSQLSLKKGADVKKPLPTDVMLVKAGVVLTAGNKSGIVWIESMEEVKKNYDDATFKAIRDTNFDEFPDPALGDLQSVIAMAKADVKALVKAGSIAKPGKTDHVWVYNLAKDTYDANLLHIFGARS